MTMQEQKELEQAYEKARKWMQDNGVPNDDGSGDCPDLARVRNAMLKEMQGTTNGVSTTTHH